MAGTDWNEVGERFNELGRAARERWGASREDVADAGAEASSEMRSAMDKVTESLDELADAITRTVNDPEIRDKATGAAAGLVEALGTSLDQLAGKIQRVGDRDEQAPGPDR